jgi:lipopolysaccharide transport system permease protein
MYQRIHSRIHSRRQWISHRQIVYYRDLLWCLVVRELKVLYKRSLLGIAWTLLNPLLQLVVFSVIFQQVLKAGAGINHYISYAFSGLLIWGWTQSALFQATGLITGNRPLIRQPTFPVPMLPIVTVTTGLIHFLLAFPALAVMMAIDRITLNWTVLFFPLLLALQFILTLSFAYPLAALNVTFRDTQHTLGVILQLLFYLLPIFYTVNDPSIPDWLKTFYAWNPLVVLLEAYRSILINGQIPSIPGLLFLIGISATLLPIGYRVFQRQSERFVEEV